MRKCSLARAVSVFSVLSVVDPAWGFDSGAPSPFRIPPVTVPSYDWSGFYVGGRRDADSAAETALEAADGSLIAARQFGYNYQRSHWVLGIDAGFTPPGRDSVPPDWTGSATARVGLAWDRWLLFGKGGAAWSSDRSDIVPASAGASGGSTTRIGWTVGGGVEFGLRKDWSVKAEYDYIDLGTRLVMMPAPASPAAAPADTGQIVHMLKFGTNYRFNWQ